MKFRLATLIVVVATLVIMASGGIAAEPSQSKGPLHITGQTPLQTLRLDIVPSRASVLNHGQIEFSQFNTWTNRWNAASDYLLDIEIVQNIMGGNVGIGKNFEIGASLPVISRSGGRLDPLISSFHSHFGLGQAGRDTHPENDLMVSYVNAEGDTVVFLNNSDRGTVLGDLNLYTKYQLYSGSNWLRSVMATALLRLPTSTDRTYYGSGGTDVALSVTAVQRLLAFYVYTTLGYGIYGSRSVLDIEMRPYQWTFFTAVEWPVSRSISLVAQEMINSGAMNLDNEFSQPTYEIVLGVKHRLSDRVMFDYGIMENLFFFNNSNDFGLNFGITYLP